jgi:transcriptional regulator with XRE-family HTH domain
MNAFSEELRKERESRAITLSDIARKTRINIKYLEALEQGAFDILPQTYIRAFIKSYAEAVGISPDRLLYSYDVIVTQKYSDAEPASGEAIRSPLIPTKEKETVIEKEKNIRLLLIIAGFTVITAVLIFVFVDTFRSTITPTHVPETPFMEIVKEQELAQPPPPVIDTVVNDRPFVPAPPDSLRLRVIAMDSVWITIIRDTLPPRSGYMRKGRYRTYYAEKEFRISLSDAGAVKVLLNGKELEPLGPSGERVRNKRITSEQLQQ